MGEANLPMVSVNCHRIVNKLAGPQEVGRSRPTALAANYPHKLGVGLQEFITIIL